MQKNNCSLSRTVTFFLVTVVALLNTSCSKKVPTTTSLVIPPAVASSNQNISALRIGVLPTQSFKEQQRMIEPLENYLEKSLKTEVNFQVASDYKQIVKWLVDGKIDVAYVTGVSYLEALEAGAEIEPLVAPIDKYTGRPWYRAAIVVKVDSNIKTLQQLKNKRFAFVNKSSASGYLMPFYALNKRGINPEEEFKKVTYFGTHAQTLEALKNGDVDAAATNIPYYLKQQIMGQIRPEEFRLIWESPPIPPSLIVVSKKLPADSIKKLKVSLLNTPEGIEDIFGRQSAGYTTIIDADYTPIRELRAKLSLKAGKVK
ncbi:MAG: phosphate/phosphite/phosphonate ABC transporter substrate-binding protein [Cyanobacteria bacterium J06621_15]